MSKFKRYPAIVSLLLITLLSFLAYVPIIPFMGFYGDDSFYAYVGHFYGPQGIMESLNFDRPSNGYLLNFYYSLLGNNILVWHISMFLMRLLGGYILFFTLLKIWPKKLTTVTSLSLLYLVYPGFLGQTITLGYQNLLTTLTLWIISLTLTVHAVKTNSKIKFFLFTILALLSQFTSFLLLEYFIGIEVLRLLIIFYLINGRIALDKISFRSFKKILVYFSPYLISLLLFVLWRIFVFKGAREITDIGWVTKTYYSDPFWIMKLPLQIFYSFISTAISAYLMPILIRLPRIPLEGAVISFSLGIASGLLLNSYYKMMNKIKHEEKLNNKVGINKFGRDVFIIGLISILGAIIPIVISGRTIKLINNFDRYTLTSIIGVSFAIIGFLYFKVPPKIHQKIIFLLITISITTHLMNGFLFKSNWDQQKDIWWQLYWRAPTIEDNAMLIFDFPPLTQKSLFNEIINKVKWYRIYWVDYQIWTIGNLFFNYQRPAQVHFNGDFLPDKNIIDKIKSKTVEPYRYFNTSISFTRDFGNSIIISAPNDTSCLWVLDKTRNEFPSHANELLRSSTIYSDIGKLIQEESIPVTPPKQIFGGEPSHGWCYYFQKASLARQLKDWNRLSQLREEVIQKGIKPKDPNEWLPFVQNFK